MSRAARAAAEVRGARRKPCDTIIVVVLQRRRTVAQAEGSAERRHIKIAAGRLQASGVVLDAAAQRLRDDLMPYLIKTHASISRPVDSTRRQTGRALLP